MFGRADAVNRHLEEPRHKIFDQNLWGEQIVEFEVFDKESGVKLPNEPSTLTYLQKYC